jgi:dihydrofolate synthase / folylpolyglutamate synthase
MDEDRGLRYLRTFPDFEQGNVAPETAFTLDRVLALLDEVGAPQLRVPVIHIAGTKGKGSTAAMIASISRAGGYRTGLFTQPHLIRVQERFQIDGECIDEADLDTIMLGTIRPAVERLRARGIGNVQQFEAQVTLAFLWFELRRVDVVVLETGLGGRLDGTNVVPTPVCVALTPIGYDHMAILGTTLGAIAAEKAAIIKAGVPTVTAPQEYEAAEVFEHTAQQLRSPLLRARKEWEVEPVELSVQGTTFKLQIDWSAFRDAGVPINPIWTAPSEGSGLKDLFTPLLGAHQAVNAGTAAVTAFVASHRLPGITPDAVRHGLASVSWPGRLQIISRQPFVILDGAHTAESARALSETIEALFAGKRLVLVVGMAVDKDIPATVAPLARLAAAAVATRSDHPRAASPDVVEAALRAAEYLEVEQRDYPWEAVQRAKSLAGAEGIVLVTGSLHVVGAVLSAWTVEQ